MFYNPTMKTTNPALNNAFEEITDCFTGTDGGIGFIKLQRLIEDMNRQADTGDESAKQIIDFVTRFARLIKVANKS